MKGKLWAWMLGITVGACQALGQLQLDWSSIPASFVNDLDDDHNSGGQATDIRKLGFYQQGSYYYFLLVTDAQPSMATFAEAYMLNFNYQPGEPTQPTATT